ncbi:MAG TPA: S9 family peptidase [Candidatus Baltobacteraceae bacterium]|jgi:dipeptidyl aminopeptidase/acylaminoacyl peptidase
MTFASKSLAVATALACCLYAVGSAAGTKPPVSAEDLYKLVLISDPQISPDGRAVVFIASRMNGPLNRYDTNLWTVSTTGGTAPKQLTTDGHASSPSWSSNGHTIAFADDASGTSQIQTVDTASGTVATLTTGTQSSVAPLFSHDGSRIAFTRISVDPRPPAQIDFTAAGFTPSPQQKTSDIRVINDERYEANGEGYTYDVHEHLWVMNAGGSGAAALLSDDRWPETPVAWSRDDKRILFSSLRHATPLAFENDLYTIAATGGSIERVASPQEANTAPAFSPDGSHVYFLAGGVKDSAEYPALVRTSLDGSGRETIFGKNRHLLGDWVLADLKMPGAVCGPIVAPDGKTIVTDESGPGVTRLVRVDVASGRFTALTHGGEASDCTASSDGTRIAYAYADMLHPAEVYVLDARSGKTTRLTSLNSAYLDSVSLSVPQPFSVRDEAGFEVPAWFMPAAGPKSGGPRPTIVAIHGGPQTEAGETFFHEMQFWCGLGYNVVLVNARGSTGYGYTYERALEGHWGPPMERDVMAVVAAAAKRPGVDPKRIGVTGGSYGGYAVLWLIGHTNRFKAAISERPASDLATQSMTWFLASPNGLGGNYAWGKPWDPHSANAADSPFTYVERVVTPVLLLHSTQDTETPIDQTLDEFSALRQLGKTAVFVEVPGENHDLNRTGSPLHRVERLHVLADWFARWLNP